MQEVAAQTTTPSAALKAIGVAYVRFGVGNPAHYRLMFGTSLTTAHHAEAGNCMPSVVAEAAGAAKRLLRDVIRQGAEQGHFVVPPNDTEALDMAVLSAWSLVHGLTVLLIDGLASEGMPLTPCTASAAEGIAGHVTQLLLDGIARKA